MLQRATLGCVLPAEVRQPTGQDYLTGERLHHPWLDEAFHWMIFNFGTMLKAWGMVSRREPPVEQAAGRLRHAEVAMDGNRRNHRIGGYTMRERGVDCILLSYSADANMSIALVLMFIGGARATLNISVAIAAEHV
jgi:hypothetical protein